MEIRLAGDSRVLCRLQSIAVIRNYSSPLYRSMPYLLRSERRIESLWNRIVQSLEQALRAYCAKTLEGPILIVECLLY